MSAFCSLCTKDPDTGEFFCARIGRWVEKCPNFSGGYQQDAERETKHDDEDEN